MKTLLLAAAILLHAGTAHAQASSPQDAVKAYFAALNEQGFSAVAQFLHPDEAERFQDMMLPVIRLAFNGEEKEFFQGMFGANASIDTITVLDAGQFVTQFMSVFDQFMQEQANFKDVSVIGVVPEGDVRHVLARVRLGAMDIEVTSMEVISLQQHQGQWMMMLTGELEGFAAALKSQIGQAHE